MLEIDILQKAQHSKCATNANLYTTLIHRNQRNIQLSWWYFYGFFLWKCHFKHSFVFHAEINISIYSAVHNTIVVDYPEVRVLSKTRLNKTYENIKRAKTLEQTFDRFDAICRYHTVSAILIWKWKKKIVSKVNFDFYHRMNQITVSVT